MSALIESKLICNWCDTNHTLGGDVHSIRLWLESCGWVRIGKERYMCGDCVKAGRAEGLDPWQSTTPEEREADQLKWDTVEYRG